MKEGLFPGKVGANKTEKDDKAREKRLEGFEEVPAGSGSASNDTEKRKSNNAGQIGVEVKLIGSGTGGLGRS